MTTAWIKELFIDYYLKVWGCHPNAKALENVHMFGNIFQMSGHGQK
jgi:hypothetical protein